MHPILFTIPGVDFPVRTFGVLVAAGFILGTHIYMKLVARYSSDPKRDLERYGPIPVWVLIGAVLGARAMYVIVEVARGSPTGQDYLAHPLTMLAIWQGGLVMYGGLLGGIIGGSLCARKNKVSLFHAMDMGLTAGFFGQAVGRIGCLMVGDDYGSVVPERFQKLPFPITLHVPSPLPPHSLFGDENAGKILWATQPMMSIKALIVASLGLWLLKRRSYPGQVSLVIILTYAMLRFLIEFLRGDEVRGVWFGGAMSTSQLMALVTGALALALLIKFRGRRVELPKNA